MKVLYDHQAFQMQRFGGISRYFAEIISHLPNDVETEVSVKYSNNEYLKEKSLVDGLQLPFTSRDKFCIGNKFIGKSTLLRFLKRFDPDKYLDSTQLNKKLTIERLKNQDFDIFHPTYYDDYFLEYLGDKPFVLTIHDMIHEIYPEFYTSDLVTLRHKNTLAERASHIIAVSENTKRDIVNILGVEPDRISVIYHSSSISENKEEPNLELPERYILYVGDRKRYKNFKFFINSICSLLRNDKTLYVVCVGHEFKMEEIDFLKLIGVYPQILHVLAKESDMYYLYNNAAVFVFPSYYEGFGIPILEAFMSECPVILSQSSCFYEIAGDAALYFESKNTVDLRDKVKSILLDTENRSELIDKANKRKLLYSWTKSAFQTREAYFKILQY